MFAHFYRVNNNPKAKEVVLMLNDENISQLEYDYYYNLYYQLYIKNYSFAFDYLDFDPDADLATQRYDFNDCAVEELITVKALIKDGNDNDFEYDSNEEYLNYIDMVEESLKDSDSTIYDYFKTFYGQYANPYNIKQFLKDGYYASAYRSYLNDTLGEDKASEYVNNLKDNYEAVFR